MQLWVRPLLLQSRCNAISPRPWRNVADSEKNPTKLPIPESLAPSIFLLSPEMGSHGKVTSTPWRTKEAMSLCENARSTIWHYDNRVGSRGEPVQGDRVPQSPRAHTLTVTYQWPHVENGPFFTSNCIHYIVLENQTISGMKINTMETRGMKFSREVGAPATHWVPLCCKLFPLKWCHASISAASAVMTTTGNNKTRETHPALKFVMAPWCR